MNKNSVTENQYHFRFGERPSDASSILGLIENIDLTRIVSSIPTDQVDIDDMIPDCNPKWFIKGRHGQFRFNFIARSYYWDGDIPRLHEFIAKDGVFSRDWSLGIQNPVERQWAELRMPGTADPVNVIGFLRSKVGYPLVQDAFPTLTAAQRDFILMGVSPEWYAKLGDGECHLY